MNWQLSPHSQSVPLSKMVTSSSMFFWKVWPKFLMTTMQGYTNLEQDLAQGDHLVAALAGSQIHHPGIHSSEGWRRDLRTSLWQVEVCLVPSNLVCPQLCTSGEPRCAQISEGLVGEELGSVSNSALENLRPLILSVHFIHWFHKMNVNEI